MLDSCRACPIQALSVVRGAPEESCPLHSFPLLAFGGLFGFAQGVGRESFRHAWTGGSFGCSGHGGGAAGDGCGRQFGWKNSASKVETTESGAGRKGEGGWHQETRRGGGPLLEGRAEGRLACARGCRGCSGRCRGCHARGKAAGGCRGGARQDPCSGEALGKVKVSVAGRDAARKAGVEGLLLSVGRADGVAKAGSARVEVDYSSFRERTAVTGRPGRGWCNFRHVR